MFSLHITIYNVHIKQTSPVLFVLWENCPTIEASEPQKTQTLASTVQPGGPRRPGDGGDGFGAFGGSERSKDSQGFPGNPWYARNPWAGSPP